MWRMIQRNRASWLMSSLDVAVYNGLLLGPLAQSGRQEELDFVLSYWQDGPDLACYFIFISAGAL